MSLLRPRQGRRTEGRDVRQHRPPQRVRQSELDALQCEVHSLIVEIEHTQLQLAAVRGFGRVERQRHGVNELQRVVKPRSGSSARLSARPAALDSVRAPR